MKQISPFLNFMESICHKLFNNNKRKFDNLQSDSVNQDILKQIILKLIKISWNMTYVNND